MDPSAYKTLKTSRGFTYNYYHSPPQDGKITILFSHGFPSTSFDWHHQVTFFKSLGYGLVVPDLLGYGGTDKPTTPESYRLKLIAKDVVEILDKEGVETAIAVGHDWGSILTSRLSVYFPDRFIGFAFLGVAYSPPRPKFNYEEALAQATKFIGFEAIGYWSFFNEDDAAQTIEEHFESFYSILFASDAKLWKTNLAPLGALKAWLLEDKKTETASYLSEEDRKIHEESLKRGGLAGPLCWYKVMVRNYNDADEAAIPQEEYFAGAKKAHFYGTTLKDPLCIAHIMKFQTMNANQFAKIIDFDSDHWVPLAQPQKLNEELLAWIKSDVENN